MKTKSRILAVILTLAMTFSMLPMTALAAEVVGPPQNQQLVSVPPKGEAGPTTGDPEVVPPTVPGPTDGATDSTTPVAPPAELPAPPAENPGPVGPHDPGAGTRAAGVCTVTGGDPSSINAEYATFADALAAANTDTGDGCTITLNEACTYAGGEISKPLTITGTNQTLSVGPTYATGFFAVKAATTISNIKVAASGDKNDLFHVYAPLTINQCELSVNNPDNGIFNITTNGSVIMNSGTLKADGFITNGGSFSLKTGTDTSTAVDILGGTIRLYKDKFITLLTGSTEPTTKFNIQTAADAAADDKIVECGTENDTLATALKDKITVNGGTNTDFTAQVATNDLTLARTNNHYVKSGAAEGGTGTYGKPYKTLDAAYAAITTTGEIRLLSDLTATEATTFGTADKTVTVTSYTDAATPKTGDGWTVKRGSALTGGHLLNITAGTVTLDHIILDGGAIWDNPTDLKNRTNRGVKAIGNVANQLVMVNGSAQLTLGDGAVLQNNQRTNSKDITGFDAGDTGSALCVIGQGVVTMNTGAEIRNNDVTSPIGDGAAVSVWTDGTNVGTFNMTGGTISGNTSTRHGAIRVYGGGTMTMSGGEITGNAVHGKDIGAYTATVGGVFSQGALTLSQTAKITGNNNLVTGKPANVTGTFAIGDNLADGANIGVTGAVGDITTDTAVEGDAAFVHSDDPKLSVAFDTNKLKLVSETHYYVSQSAAPGGNGSFGAPFQTLNEAVTEAVKDTSAEIRLLSDVDVTAQNNFNTGDNVTICSANPATGVPTTEDNVRFKLIRKTPTMLQLFGSSVVTLKEVIVTEVGGSTNEANSPLVVGNAAPGNESAKLVLEDGATVTETSGNFSAVYLFAGNLEMKTGSLITKHNNRGGVPNLSLDPAQGAGGGVTVGGTQPAHLKMSGGTITGNTAHTGGGVYVVKGDVTIQGAANISGNNQAGGVPSNVFLKKGQTVKLSNALTEGANIGVYTQMLPADGGTIPIATKAGGYTYTPTADDAKFFHSDNSGKAVVQFETNRIVLGEAITKVYVANADNTTDCTTAGSDTADGSIATPFLTLKKAYDQVSDGGTICVLDALEVATQTTFNSNKNVTIASYTRSGDGSTTPFTAAEKTGAGWTVKRIAGLANQTAFTVSAGNVTLKNIIFDGGAKWSSADAVHLLDRTNDTAGGGIVNVAVAIDAGQLFTVNAGGALTLDSGAVLQNNDRQHSAESGGDRGSAVYVNSGKLTMNNGASIKDNRVTNAGFGNIGDGAAVAVWYNGQFHMNGGSITGNTVGRMGGAIRVVTDIGTQADMYMSGGTISGNATKSTANGGGISVNSGYLHLSGAPVVKDNLHGATIEAAVASNVSFKVNHLVMDGRLTGAANIGLWASGNSEATTATAVYNDLQYFHSDNTALAAKFENNKIVLSAAAENTYVSNSGNDLTGDGTSAHPFATIARAYGQVADAGTIHVMNDIQVGTDIAFKSNKVVTITSCKADGNVWATAADTHTISQGAASQVMFGVEKGTVKFANIVLKGRAAHNGRLLNVQSGATACIQDGTVLKDSVSNFSGGAVYIFAGGTLTMTGGTITGNSCTNAGRGGAVYAENTAHFNVQGDVKIFGNTTTTSVGEGVYLMEPNILNVNGNLAATAHIDLGVDSNMEAAKEIGTASGDAADNGTTANLSAIVAAPLSPNLVAVRKTGTPGTIQWAAADTNWLDAVAAANYGWNDDATNDGVSGGGVSNNGSPDSILVNTPAKLYSLAWAIQNNYKTGNTTGDGAKYADGYYYVTADIDMTGFTWIPLGTTLPFTGVFEGAGVRTISGINYQANALFGLFGTVGVAGGKVHAITGTNAATPLNALYTGTAIYNLAVDGSKTTGKAWAAAENSSHLGGIAAKATKATIQNCTVKNLNLSIVNYAGDTFVGGIAGEVTDCIISNNSVGQSGTAMTLTSDTGTVSKSAFAGGIVGKMTGTNVDDCVVSGNTVGGNNDHRVTIQAVPQGGTELIYAGGVVGLAVGGTISNETYAHLNAMTVSATTFAATSKAYAGGVAGYLNGAVMTNCTPGANGGETHSITADKYSGGVAGKHYAGGLVGGMEGTSSITSSTIGASNAQSYTVTAGVGVESVAGGLVGTMTAGTSLTDCTISGDSIDSVKVTANGAAGTAGGLVGTAMDARVIKCNAQNITIAGGKASGGLAGTFAASSARTEGSAVTDGGVMAMCYERNCEVTGFSHCDMIQTATNALVLACYATKAAPQGNGVYAVKTATDSKFVGCYTTANTAFAVTDGTYINCYFVGSETAAADDTVKGIPLTAFTDSNDATLRGFMNDKLDTEFATVTGNLRMGYMAGQSAQINGNYNYPVYAVWLLTVNSLPSSVYGTYTVTADGKAIATGATGFNQYWVGKDALVTITGDPDDYYATADAATFTITNAAGDGTDSAITDVAMNRDKTATVTFTQHYFPGWTINGTHSDNATIYSDASIQNGALGVVTDNKLAGNTVKNWERDASHDWAEAARTIKTIFVTASTTTSGASNPTISAFTADGWTVATGGVGKAYVQLTNAQGANAAAVSAIVNSFAFAAEKTATGDVTVDVQVYVDETIRGSMYFFGGSIYELAGSAVGQPAAKALAENSTLGAKKGHLVVIGSSAEHAFLKDNVKTNAWTAAVTSAPTANAVGTWTWAGVTATPDETSYLQNQSSWQGGEPNNSGTYATYNYGGKFDDTNGANVALIEYDALSAASAAGWQAYSALANGTVTCHVEVPVAPNPGPDVGPTVDPNPGKGVTNPHDNGVSKLLETDKHIAYMRGDDKGNFNPEKGITRAETAQMFYNLLKNKDIGEVAKFSDVEAAAWYADAVNTLAALKIIQGRDADKFAPDDTISRAEFTAIAMRFADSVKGQKTFTDVPSDYWAENYIAGAAQYGWIDGYGDGTFKPFGNIKRCEAAKIVNTMLWRFADTVYVDKAKNLKTFPDVATSDWAFYDIMEAANGHDFKQDKNGLETWTK